MALREFGELVSARIPRFDSWSGRFRNRSARRVELDCANAQGTSSAGTFARYSLR